MASSTSLWVGVALGSFVFLFIVFGIVFVCFYNCVVRQRKSKAAEADAEADDTSSTSEMGKGSTGPFCCFFCCRNGSSTNAKKSGNVLGIPKAPVNVNVRDVDEKSLTLTWTPHMRDARLKVRNYHVLYRMSEKGWKELGKVSAKSTEFHVKGLKQDVPYFFGVNGQNRFGTGPAAETLSPTVLHSPVPPKPPLDVHCSEKDETSLTLAWKTPKEEGNAKIESYHILVRTEDGDWKDIGKVKAEVHEYKVEGVDAGKTYVFGVAASNKAGRGQPSELKLPLKAKKSTVPSLPTEVCLLYVKEDQLTVSWNHPLNDGGAEVLCYHLMIQVGHGSWEYLDQVVPNTTSYCVTGLVTGTPYRFQVIAENQVGESSPSASNTITLKKKPVVPRAPAELFVKDIGATFVTLSWRAPLQDGGAKVDAYHIQVQETGGEMKELPKVWGFDGTYTVDNLNPGSTYNFRICAENKIGRGPFLETTEPVEVTGAHISGRPRTSSVNLAKPGIPGGPLQAVAVATRSVTVSWKPPARDGPAQVTSYVVEYQDVRRRSSWLRGGVVEPPVTKCKVESLHPDCEYLFRVVAVNTRRRGDPLESKDKIRTRRPQGPRKKGIYKDPLSMESFEKHEGTPMPPADTLRTPVPGELKSYKLKRVFVPE